MSKPELLQQYKSDVNNLRKCAKELNISDKRIDQIFQECFKDLTENRHVPNNAQKYFSLALKVFLIFTTTFIFIYILLNVHQPTSSLVLRNVQGLIYPGLKVLRFISAPLIKLYPSLTGLYDESCLVENPFFYVSEMECWPCENVHSVINLTGFNNHSLYDSGTPFIIKTQHRQIFFEDLKHLYLQHKLVFDTANHIKGTNPKIFNLEELFNSEIKASTHVSWRINKMSPARIIRTLFPRPPIISEWSGQSIERYLMIDGSKSSPYVLPNLECSFVILAQSSGERTIILNPSEECSNVCKTVSVILKPSYILWYNWWYWRPISLPTENSTDLSITYISSYC